MKQPCRECGKMLTNLLRDVGEERHRWPGPKTDWLCRDCHYARVQQGIERVRRELGLETAKADKGS